MLLVCPGLTGNAVVHALPVEFSKEAYMIHCFFLRQFRKMALFYLTLLFF